MSNRPTAISLAASKEASLYFDNVVPLCVLADFTRSLPAGYKISDISDSLLDATRDPAIRFFDGLLPKHLRDSPDYAAALVNVEMVFFGLVMKPAIDKFNLFHLLGPYITETEYEDLWGTLRRRYSKFADQFQLHGFPVITTEGLLGDDSKGNDFLVTLHGLNLIDTNKATWEQIAEFRKDSKSITQIRRLRLFAAERYQGRDRAFIEDDLLSRIDAYHDQVRRWGFETAHAALGMLLSSRTVAGALGGALVSTLAGAPSIAAATALGGIVIECGKVAVEVSRRRTALRNALSDNPVSYIIRAQSEIG